MSAVVERMPAKNEISLQLEEMAAKFREALPKHIPVERFARVVATAIQQTPALLNVDRRSLWQAAMKAAQDGLLPDGREAALVVYRDRNRGEIAQYMPMIAGLRKKVRNSGEIATWEVNVVCENDGFEFELGDEPFIRHRPAMGDRGKPIAAYSIATLKSGEKSREVMSFDEIEAIRKRSRAANAGPWVTDWAEMARKTVARRHSKVLPMSTDLDDLIRQDDALYDMEGDRDAAPCRAPRPTLGAVLDKLAESRPAPAIAETTDPETGEVHGAPTVGAAVEQGEDEPSEAGGPSSPTTPTDAPAAAEPEDKTALVDAAFAAGQKARAKGMSRRAVPGEYRERPDLAQAWRNGFDHPPVGTGSDEEAGQ